MLFGTAQPFAIEAKLQEICGKWTYGMLRFLVDGSPIGNFENTSDLATSARWGRTFLGASARRTRADLDGVESNAVYELLYGRFVVPVNDRFPKPYPGPWDRDPFLLDDVGDYALRDHYAVLAVRRGDGMDRILVTSFEREQLTETLVPSGVCDQVIEAYCSWVEQLRVPGA